jgi:hypothetical protein
MLCARLAYYCTYQSHSLDRPIAVKNNGLNYEMFCVQISYQYGCTNVVTDSTHNLWASDPSCAVSEGDGEFTAQHLTPTKSQCKNPGLWNVKEQTLGICRYRVLPCRESHNIFVARDGGNMIRKHAAFYSRVETWLHIVLVTNPGGIFQSSGRCATSTR